jgi:hypothetical protein
VSFNALLYIKISPIKTLEYKLMVPPLCACLAPKDVEVQPNVPELALVALVLAAVVFW